MTSRVEVIRNSSNIIIVAPHGNTDNNTDLIAELIAKGKKYNAIINKGFKKRINLDISRDFADCNNIKHLSHPVVNSEFLQPILNTIGLIKKYGYYLNKKPNIYIIYIHGCNLPKEYIKKNVMYILGVGLGKKQNSLCCDSKTIHTFLDIKKDTGYTALLAGPGSKYAAFSSNNLTQFFRKRHLDYTVKSVQLEIPKYIRESITGINEFISLLGQRCELLNKEGTYKGLDYYLRKEDMLYTN